MVESAAVTTSKSKELFDKAKKTIPGGVNSPVRAFEPNPFFAARAEGSKLYGVDGEVYIDYCMAYGAIFLGHANPEVAQAVTAQLKHGSLFGVPTALEVEFAERVKELFPSVEMLRLVNSGTEATMHAIRTARGYTGRKKIIKFEGCFHGAHDCVLVKAGSGASTFGAPTSPGIPTQTTQNTIVLSYNNPQAIEETFKREGNDIAAVIVEPVMGNAGLILPKQQYLQQLRRTCSEYGAVLIFDEIITGFRLALGGAQEHYGVQPDMTTLGKVLGGGFPLAVFGGKKEIMQHISPSGKVYQAGTFCGNPISTTAATKTLQILQQNQKEIYPRLQKNGAELKKALTDYAADYNLQVQVHNIASMFQIFFTAQPVWDYQSVMSADIERFQAYFRELLKQGIFIPPAQFETCFLSNAHSEDDLKATVEAFGRALKAASKVGGKSA
ncbi:MAG: glutamate-1-semialdehyde 2,1-aminomutase [Candidatus Bathyarchaeota archaeon]|nr:glutamate-1-semialdehyde 2,1-aminomutase [Candidatus Bathyarchaeota archaeon]